jgi:uncharacterized protein
MNPVFLRAEWRYLLMSNFAVEPRLLTPFLPKGTQLDFYQDRTFISLVGFMFQRTLVMGIPIPFHRNFQEVNLRFYVVRQTQDGPRRGVVFIREIVPRFAVAWVARNLYEEPYVTFPMRHHIQQTEQHLQLKYSWLRRGRWESMFLEAIGAAQSLKTGSEAEFIFEHYWGYTRRQNGTSEYQVEHPRWKVWPGQGWKLECNVESLYGQQFVESLASEPASTFIADGSEVTVRHSNRIEREN